MATTRLQMSFSGSEGLINMYSFPDRTCFLKCLLNLLTSSTSSFSKVGCIEFPEH